MACASIIVAKRNFVAYSEDGQSCEITAQVCDVNRPLLNVSKIVSAGNRLVFDWDGSYIEDVHSGGEFACADGTRRSRQAVDGYSRGRC